MNGALYEEAGAAAGRAAAPPLEVTPPVPPASAPAPLHIPAKRPSTTLTSGFGGDPADGVIRHSAAQPWGYAEAAHPAGAAFDAAAAAGYQPAFVGRDVMTSMASSYYNLAADSRHERKPLAFWPNKYEYAAGPSTMGTAADSCQPFGGAQSWCNYPAYGRVPGPMDTGHGQHMPYLHAAEDSRRAMEVTAYPHDAYGLRNYPGAEGIPPAPYHPGEIAKLTTQVLALKRGGVCLFVLWCGA